MSLYNDNIKTREFEAVYSSNTRVQIDFDDGVYLPNAVLAVTPLLSGTMPADGHIFVVNAGAYACIDKIMLRSGTQVIAQTKKVPDVATFYNLLQDNGSNGSKNKFLYGVNSGYQVDDVDLMLHGTSLPDIITDDITDTPTFYIPLNRVLKFLNATRYLNTSKYQNLNIVVEFRTDVANWFEGAVNGDVTCDFQTNKPSILIDQVLGGPKYSEAMALFQKGQTFPFLDIQHDNIAVQATGAVVAPVASRLPITKTDEELNNFTNKYVNRMFIQLVDVTNGIVNLDLNVNKLQKSDAFVAEKLQVRVNNNALFQGDGIDKPMTKTGLLSRSWGSQNISLGANLHISDFTKKNDLIPAGDITNQSVGEQSWYGFDVKQPIKSLQIQYQRGAYGAAAADPGQGPAVMNIYGEVLKQMQFTDSGFVIVNV